MSKDGKASAGRKLTGTITRCHAAHGPQALRGRGRNWTDETEELFIDTLAATCNVRLAAATCNFSFSAIYKRRRGDAAFAARWQQALEQGYARIEMALVLRALQALEGEPPDPDTPIPAMTVAEALNVLKLHRPALTGEGRSPGWRGRPRNLEEVRASILTKLEAIEAARGAGTLP